MTAPKSEHAPEMSAMVLQGGGALGAYQAGAYEALAAADYAPTWLAGISIGALNAAIIAGNPPERRVERLRSFWDGVSSGLTGEPFIPGTLARSFFNETSAAVAAAAGIPGFFAPRFPPPVLMPPGSMEAISHYDTRPLKRTLDELIDFEMLNSGEVRLSVGAVNVATGNFAYFDTADMTLGPEHIMASGALPPGFPPVEIDGQLYWDGGLVSNTPLQYVLDRRPQDRDLCVFQVDLFSARGRVPQTLWEVEQREKDIRFSSRTRMNTDVMHRLERLRSAARRLCHKLPEELQSDPDVKVLLEGSCHTAVTITHLINRAEVYETQSKDYDFSRLSVTGHWEQGGQDVRRTLRQQAWRHRKRPEDGIAVFDLARESKD